MRVIFLDFDGVVVCLPQERTAAGRHALNRPAVTRLNEIIGATEAVVVVSSTWRIHQPIDHLRGYLEEAGFVGVVHDVTPDLNNLSARVRTGVFVPRHEAGLPDTPIVTEAIERGHEVATWLDAHPEVVSYVVLDDDSDRGPIPPERWVHVHEGWINGGLQEHHARLAKSLLLIPVSVSSKIPLIISHE